MYVFKLLATSVDTVTWLYSKKTASTSCLGHINLSPPGACFKNRRQSHSCCLEEGVILPFRLNVSPCTANTDWVHEAGYPWASPMVGFLCGWVCLYVRVFLLNRGGVDCHFTDTLRHSQYTLMVIVVSTGQKMAGLLAWHASCLPLSVLRAVTLWEVTDRKNIYV